MDLYDVIIVGAGPAGLSAALILGRCRRHVAICDAGRPRNRASKVLHGFLSRDGADPLDLLRIGREEVARYDVEFKDATVTGAHCADDAWEVRLDDGHMLHGRKLVLATGIVDVLPDIPNITEFYGRSVWHCPYCDAWEYKDQPIAVYGTPRNASDMAISLLTWTDRITLCTDAKPGANTAMTERAGNLGFDVRNEKIVRLEGSDGYLERLIFEQGEPLECRALFFNTGPAQQSPLAEILDCSMENHGHLQVDLHCRTGGRNLYLVGDASGEVQFAIVAAGEGAITAAAINRDLQEEDRQHRQQRRQVADRCHMNAS